MILEKIVRGGRKGLIATGLVGSLGLGGCSTAVRISETEGQILAGEALMQSGDEKATIIGSLLYSLGLMRHEKEMVRERSNINININQREDGRYVPVEGYAWVSENPNDLRVMETNIRMFACNYSKDFNGDGFANYPDEFVGIKTTFRDYEQILIVLYDKTNLESNKSLQIYDPKGNLIHEVSFMNKKGGVGLGDSEEGGDFDMMDGLIQSGGYGNYKIVWKINGQYVGSNEFEIVPSNRE